MHWDSREFANTHANHLGIPLPAGRLRSYRQDEGGNLEFLGESQIPHTPENEPVNVYTGYAFDLTGNRVRTDYAIDTARYTLDESFEVTLHNHKQAPAEIGVVEHLYRGDTWGITQHSNVYLKTDSHTIEFRLQVPPGGEKDTALTPGEHTMEADIIGSDLRMNPLPASVELEVGVNPEQQIAGLVAQLGAATTDDQRETVIQVLVRQPPSRVLPALREARTKANESVRWWIDAAIQQIAAGTGRIEEVETSQPSVAYGR